MTQEEQRDLDLAAAMLSGCSREPETALSDADSVRVQRVGRLCARWRENARTMDALADECDDLDEEKDAAECRERARTFRECAADLEREWAGTEPTALVRCVVTRQGGPILNGGYVVAAGENVAAIEIDMGSKRCEVMAESETEYGAPVIWLDGENALHLKKGHEKEQTEVAFPDYKGWIIFSADVCRYTLRVCFVRDKALNDKIRSGTGTAAPQQD